MKDKESDELFSWRWKNLKRLHNKTGVDLRYAVYADLHVGRDVKVNAYIAGYITHPVKTNQAFCGASNVYSVYSRTHSDMTALKYPHEFVLRKMFSLLLIPYVLPSWFPWLNVYPS